MGCGILLCHNPQGSSTRLIWLCQDADIISAALRLYTEHGVSIHPCPSPSSPQPDSLAAPQCQLCRRCHPVGQQGLGLCRPMRDSRAVSIQGQVASLDQGRIKPRIRLFCTDREGHGEGPPGETGRALAMASSSQVWVSARAPVDSARRSLRAPTRPSHLRGGRGAVTIEGMVPWYLGAADMHPPATHM